LPGNMQEPANSFVSDTSFTGETIKPFNWASTPLGDPAYWPDELRNAVQAYIVAQPIVTQAAEKNAQAIAEENLKNVFEQTPYAVCTLRGPEFVIETANKAALELWGKIAEETINKPIREAFPELIRQGFLDMLADVYTSGRPFTNNESAIQLVRNGKLEEAYINFTYEPLYGIDGAIYGIMGAGVDITAQVLLRKEIEKSEIKFRSIVSQAPVAITIFQGSDFVVEVANEAYLAIIDRKQGDFVGKPFFESVPELEGQGIRELLTEVLASGQPYQGSELGVDIMRYGRREKIYFNFVYHPLRDGNNAVYAIMVVANDITEQIIARHQVEEKARQFGNLIKQSPVAMAIFLGRDMIIDMANDNMLKKLWRKPLEEVKGKKLVDAFPELEQQPFPALLQQVYSTGIAYTENEATAYIQYGTTLQKFYLDFEYAPLFEPTRGVYGIIITVIDVTEKVEARNKIEEAELRLRLANEAARLGTFDWDLTTQVFVQSKRLKEIFGVADKADGTHDDLINAFHEQDKELRNQAVKDSYEKGSLQYEARIIWPDNSVHWVRVYGKVFFDDNQAPRRMVGTVQDITQEKNILKLLEAEEMRSRLAIESAQLATFDWDVVNDKVTHSPRFSEIFGEPSNTPILRGAMLKNIHPDDKHLRDKAVEQSFNTGHLHYEVRIIWPDTTVHWIKVFGKIVFDENRQARQIFGIVQDVTKEKEAVALLAENEDRLRMALESAELATWDLHLNPVNIYYSPRLAQMFGYNQNKILTSDELRAHIHPQDLQIVIDAHIKALTERELKYEVRIIWKDGSIHWIMCSGKTLFNEKLQAVRMLGIMMDVTDRKNIEAELERKVEERTQDLKISREQHHKMIDEIQDYAILLLDSSGIIQNWNMGAEKIKGYTESEVIGKSFRIFYTDEDRENKVPESLINEAKKYGRASTEGWRVRKNGSKFWASVVITALHDDTNNIIGLTKVTRDLTERKIIEEQRQLQTQELSIKNYELRQQKEFVDVILDSSVDIISVFDADLQYITVNKAFEKIYNVKRKDVLGRKITEVFFPEKTEVFREYLSKAMAGESIHGVLHRSPITGKHYESFFIPLINNKEVYAVLAVAHDNTDILESAKKLEEANAVLEEKTEDLQRANTALEKSNSELEQYAYVASHDLQEPLRKIRTYSGILNDTLKDKVDNASLNMLQKVISSATRMSNLIYDLLNFSRLLNPERHFEKTDLDKTFENIINDFELIIEQKRAVIQVEKMPVIEAVPLQMNQLFYNLVNNALKFSTETRLPVINIRAQKVSDEDVHANPLLNNNLQYVDITIADNGIGFSQQYAEQIFEVFKRLHTKQAYQGSGIGLALCRRIALNHQGDIFAEGKENDGSVFHVILPLQQSKL